MKKWLNEHLGGVCWGVIIVSNVISAMLLSGCGSLLPQKRSEAAAVKTADSVANRQSATFERVLETGVKVPQSFWKEPQGTNFPVQMGPLYPFTPYVKERTSYETDTATTAGSSEAASSRFKVSLPLGVTLGLLAVSIIGLVFAVKIARKNSVAADAAFRMADEGAAKAIQFIRHQAQNSTDPQSIAGLNNIIANMESERGKVAVHRRPPRATR